MESPDQKAEKSEGTTRFNRDDYKKRLEAMYKTNRLFPAVLAARNALRVLPIIAKEGHLDFWQSNGKNDPSDSKSTSNDKFIVDEGSKVASSLKKKEGKKTEPKNDYVDKRAINLLAIFMAPITVIQQLALKADKRDVESMRAAAVDATAFATDAVAYAVGAGYSLGAAYSDADADIDAYLNAIAATGVAYIGNMGAIQVIEDELQTIEKGLNLEQLLLKPLWPNGMPKDLAKVYQAKFKPVVNQLISQHKNSDIAAALTGLLTQYEILINGQNQSTENQYRANGEITPENSHQLDDNLGREPLVDGLSKLITHEVNSEHLTIGLLGHWGSGKTRILALLKAKVKEARQEKSDGYSGFLFGEFNAWAYEHAKNNQAAMAHEVIKSLTSFQDFKTISKDTATITKWWYALRNHGLNLLWKLFVRTRVTFGFMAQKYPVRLIMFSVWLGLIVTTVVLFASQVISIDSLLEGKQNLLLSGLPYVSLFGLWRIVKDAKVLFAQPYTKELLTYIKLPNYAKQIGEISEMREDIRLMANIRLGTKDASCSDWLGKILPPKRLLFVVDDLDRCGPEGIVKTFEAIRLVLDIPQVYVVIAVDQRIALAALALHYEKLREHHQLNDAKAIARDYLAKMIQLPIVVDDGDPQTLEGYMSHLWNDQENEAQHWLRHLHPDRYQEDSPNDESKSDAEPLTPQQHKEQAQHEQDNISAKKLSDKEIVDRVLALTENKTKKVIKEFTGLQPEHKAAFAYWAQRFELSNARQIKRLYNSYNLIRLVSGNEDQLCENSKERFAYGILVALLAIESINSLEDPRQRRNTGAFLRTGHDLETLPEDKQAVFAAARDIITLSAQQRFEHLPNNARYAALLESVELFVLPAINGFEADDAKNS